MVARFVPSHATQKIGKENQMKITQKNGRFTESIGYGIKLGMENTSTLEHQNFTTISPFFTVGKQEKKYISNQA